jgi:hypothetical protein
MKNVHRPARATIRVSSSAALRHFVRTLRMFSSIAAEPIRAYSWTTNWKLGMVAGVMTWLEHFGFIVLLRVIAVSSLSSLYYFQTLQPAIVTYKTHNHGSLHPVDLFGCSSPVSSLQCLVSMRFYWLFVLSCHGCLMLFWLFCLGITAVA